MALWRLYYHFVWATRERQPMIRPEFEEVLYGYVLGKAHALGAIPHAVGGIEDHMHFVASVPPKLSLAHFVKGIKGSSAHYLNHVVLADSSAWFGWQRGYGVFSVGSKRLGAVVDYVRHQKERHGNRDLIIALERHDHEDDGPAPWNHGEAVAGIRVIEV